MKCKLEWLTTEEGQITAFLEDMPGITARVFITGEEEAEFQLQDVVLPDDFEKNDTIRQKIILNVTKCISECFRLLWEEGYEETVLVEPQGTKLAEILGSTSVVQKMYSECMMECRFEPKKSTGCGTVLIRQAEDEDGILYENEDKTFSCKIITCVTEQPEEKLVYLHGVHVRAEERKRGVATACLTGLFQMLSEGKPLCIHLQVGTYNKPAVHLYEKLGFQVFEGLDYYAMEE